MMDSDAFLLARVRDDGDASAFASLYERHAPAARRFARSLCRNEADADDLTAEVFTGLLTSLQRGNGPTELALPYLFASIRHRQWRVSSRRTRESAVASTWGARTTVCETADVAEADVVRAALASLPDDVQVLLWRTEVDDESVDAAVEREGTSPHHLAVHRHRARRALGTAYLAQHAEPDGGLANLDPECQATVQHLAALVRNKVGVRRRRHLVRHLRACPGCTQVHDRLALINTRLRLHPKLPWNLWATGLTTAIKTQVSGWLGASMVSVAGSGALVVAVFAPAAMLLDQGGPASSPPATAPTAPTAPVRADLSARTSDDPSPVGADPDGATWPGAADRTAEPAQDPVAMDVAPPSRVTHVASTTATDEPIGAPSSQRRGDDLAASESPVVPSTVPGPTAQPTNARTEAPADEDDGDDDDQGDDQGGGQANGATKGTGVGSSRGNGGPGSGSQDNADGQANGNGPAGNGGQGSASSRGNANSEGRTNGPATGNGQGIGNGNGPANAGPGNGHGQANGNRPGTGTVEVVDEVPGRGLARGHDKENGAASDPAGAPQGAAAGHEATDELVATRGPGNGLAEGHAGQAEAEDDGAGAADLSEPDATAIVTAA
jgi:RNA polymerase sigma factor (sigma-70 family)